MNKYRHGTNLSKNLILQLVINANNNFCVHERRVPQEIPSPDEASRVFLRTKAGYDPDPGRCVTATFKAGLLSMPASTQGARVADELGYDGVSKLLGGSGHCLGAMPESMSAWSRRAWSRTPIWM